MRRVIFNVARTYSENSNSLSSSVGRDIGGIKT